MPLYKEALNGFSRMSGLKFKITVVAIPDRLDIMLPMR